jgi:hypothetical protein
MDVSKLAGMRRLSEAARERIRLVEAKAWRRGFQGNDASLSDNDAGSQPHSFGSYGNEAIEEMVRRLLR